MLETVSQGERLCARTGLALLPSNRVRIWRVAKAAYGPLNPQVRDAATDRATWGRYDAAGHHTVYGAQPMTAAYAETLAVFRPALNIPLHELFDDIDPTTVPTLADAVRHDWQTHHHQPGTVFAGWRHERRLYTLTLPESGWFVDIEHSESVAAIRKALGARLAELDLDDLTVATLRSEDRRVTTTIAEWIHRQVLDDGSPARGIRYRSKHGTDWHCWAIWLRDVDDGKSVRSEPTKSDQGTAIEDCHRNAELQNVARLFRLKIW